MDLFGLTRRMLLPTSGRMDLDGKVALVTGAGDGIGLATARLLHERGAYVVLLDRDESAAKRAAADLGERALAVTADVTERAAMTEAVRTAVDYFGALDVVVANAGITPPPATFRTLDPAEFDRVMAVNVTGVLNTVQPAIEELIRNQGHVVVVASAAAFSPPMGGASYMVSKAAVEMMARGLKLELAAHGVTVTTSYFGVVETLMTRATLDDDPVGADFERMVPAILRRRITPEKAGEVIVHAIEHRAPSSIAPLAWQPLGILRGVLNPLLDRYLVGDEEAHEMLRRLEARADLPARLPS